jgi:uncharacterized MAPEG superfamily protein
MSIELTYLTLTALLAASLWIPYIIGINKYEVEGDNFVRPADLSKYPEWVHRAHRAHLNLLEQALPFAIIVLIGQMQGVSTALTAIAVTAFFWLRVAHAIGMISGIAKLPLRPLIYVAGWLCIVILGSQVLLHG